MSQATMNYAADRVCYDADSHVMETFSWIKDFADPQWRDRLGELNLGGAGAMAKKAIEAAQARTKDAVATDKLAENVIASAKGWAALGAFDSAERKRVMDLLGFKAQLVFSTFAGTQFLHSNDLDLKYAGAAAHNRAMAAFCDNDARLMGVGSLPLEDPARALAEAKAANALGLRAVWVSASPAGDMSPGHPDLDPVWAYLAEANLPFMLHIGQGSRVLNKAYENNGQPRPKDWLGGGENLRVKDYMVLPFAPIMFLSAMVFDGVFERHPALRGGVIELGAGWVPNFLDNLDQGGRMFGKSDPAVGGLSLKPSDYIRRHVRFTPFATEDAGKLIALAGDDLFLFSSDYPHPEGGKDPIGKFESSLDAANISSPARDGFYAENFKYMMGL